MTDINMRIKDFNIDFCEDLRDFYEDGGGKIPKGDKFTECRCPDAMYANPIAELKTLGTKDEFITTKDRKIAEPQSDGITIGGKYRRIKQIPKIILVRESPHRREYKDNKKIAPAQGQTGRNIKEFLPLIFSDQRFSGYYVVLVNSIQYQCSLGRKLNQGNNRKDKNELFNFLLKKEAYEDSLIRRIQCIYSYDADVIVNCCTQGNCTYQGRKCEVTCPDENNSYLVYLAIKKICDGRGGGKVLRMNHPISWHSSCANRCVWFYPRQYSSFLCEKDFKNLHWMIFGKHKGLK